MRMAMHSYHMVMHILILVTITFVQLTHPYVLLHFCIFCRFDKLEMRYNKCQVVALFLGRSISTGCK